METLKSFLDVMAIGVLLVGRDGVILHGNEAAAEMLGYGLDEIGGLPIDMLVPDNCRERHRLLLSQFFSHPRPRKMRSGHEFTVRRKDGGSFSADISLSAIERQGEIYGLVSLIDLTEHRRRQQALDRSTRALTFLSGSNRSLLRATDPQSLLETVCRLACDVGGYWLAWVGRANSEGGKSVTVIAKAGAATHYLEGIDIRWDDSPHGSGPTGTAIRTGLPTIGRFLRDQPSTSPWYPRALEFGFQASLSLPLRVDGEIFGALTLYATDGAAFDEEETRLLSEVADDLAFGLETLRLRDARRQAEEKLRDQARTDFVTGLANRARLSGFLEEQLERQTPGALLFVELEHFKEVNDTHGYLAGDQLLRDLGERFARDQEPGTLLARIGGDEFALALPGADTTRARRAATRLAGHLATPFLVGGMDVWLRARIGVTFYPDLGYPGAPGGAGTRADEIYAAAGLASRDALPVPTERTTPAEEAIAFYRPTMSAGLGERMEMARRLKMAIANGDLALHYQPKIDLDTGHLTGAEALARWHDPVLGQVPPARFIPLAEERGLMPALGRWALSTACRQVVGWKRAGMALPGRLAVNVSALQFDYRRFPQEVVALALASGCPPASLELEITETVLASNREEVTAAIHALKDRGFSFAIDDFGTGFSSLAYLSRFPVGTLKIDISFVHAMLESPGDHVIVRTIIGMARGLGLRVVAEGVSTPAQADALRSLGCHEAQGYLYAAAEPAESFAARWLAAAL